MRLRTNPFKFFIYAFLLISGFILIILRNYTQLELWISATIALNLSAFIITGYDKSIAASKDERVPEKVLYGIALFGGSLGLLLGMNFFRHKTKKSSFQLVIGIIVVIQILIIKALKF